MTRPLSDADLQHLTLTDLRARLRQANLELAQTREGSAAQRHALARIDRLEREVAKRIAAPMPAPPPH